MITLNFICQIQLFPIQIWSGADILKDGQCILECYGGSLDVLNEGDCVGIMRTSEGEAMNNNHNYQNKKLG